MKFNILNYIPGFRSKNTINTTLAVTYYVLVLILGYPSISIILMGLTLPAFCFFFNDIIKIIIDKRFNKNEFTIIAILSLVFIASSYYGTKDFSNYINKKNENNIHEKNYSPNQREFESEVEYEQKIENRNIENPEMNLYFYPAVVDKIIDAKTIIIRRDNSIELETIKLLGISLENEKIDKDSTLSYSRNLLKGRRVFLEKDSTEKDEEGNSLFYLWLNQPKSKNITKEDVEDLMFNAQLVKNGYVDSEFYPPNIKYLDWFDEFENTAKENKWGIWADTNDVFSNEESIPDYTKEIVPTN